MTKPNLNMKEILKIEGRPIINLCHLRQQLRELLNEESVILDQIAVQFEKDRDNCRKQLKFEMEELKKLEEIERKELAESEYRYLHIV